MWSHHKHQVKIGVASLGILVHDYDPDTFNGAFVFGGGLAPALDNSGQETAISGLEQYRRTLLTLPGGVPTTYKITQGTPLVPFAQWRAAFFARCPGDVCANPLPAFGIRRAVQTTPTERGKPCPRPSPPRPPGTKPRCRCPL